MKRLVKKAENKYDIYMSVVRELMNNDHNATWDEIYSEFKEEYSNENEALDASISEIVEALQIILNENLDPEEKEEYEFYNTQLNKLINL